MYIIYKVLNGINKKIYIGKTIRDTDDYLGSGKLINRAIKKYGIENFSKEIIDTAESIAELNEKEKCWIKEYNSTDLTIGYNIAFGGNGGDLFTNNPNKEIIRKKYSRKGKDNPMFGRKHSDETKKRISLNKKGQRKGIPTWNKGMKISNYSDEYKRRLKENGIRNRGSNNHNSKKYLIVSPDGNEYVVHGTMREFAIEHDFFPTTLYYFVDKGKIPKSNRKCTPQRTKLTEWEIIKL